MINLEKVILAEPKTIANMMCYLAYDCEHCPIYRRGENDFRSDTCRMKLFSWLMEQADEEFWRYLDEQKREG